MSFKLKKAIRGGLTALVIGTASTWMIHAARGQGNPRADAKQRLEVRYGSLLAELKAEITAALPALDEQKTNAYLEARKAEDAANARLGEASQELGKVGAAAGAVGHAQNTWIARADQRIAAARAQLEQAATAEDRNAAQEALAAGEANRQDGVEALAERTAVHEALKQQEPQLKLAVEAAEAELARAQAATMKALEDLGLIAFLSSDVLDAQLAKYVLLFEAQPGRLAEFAAQSEEHEALVEGLLADHDLILQMMVADGASDGLYGEAMQVYRAIQQASDKAGTGTLQRLALAVALEHAKPIGQRNAVAATDSPSHVDPVNRYLHFEKAYLKGELDRNFAGLSVWDYRFIVDGNEPDEILTWGRAMLRNYRPDHIATGDDRWRYVALVRTDIRYGSQDNRHDRDDLQFYQNILKNGGVCGRRAFIGRMVLRAFGVPTTARPQRGHAALVRWTPTGWVPVLGAGWGSGWTNTRYRQDRDFLANTQGRAVADRFLEVKRGQWVGDVLGEGRVFGFHSGNPGLWYGASLYQQRAIIEARGARALDAIGEELGEANESNVQYAFESATVTDADLKIAVDADGVITIPAVACSSPTQSTGKIIFMNSFLGGRQLHYSRGGAAENFEYTFEAPAGGRYALSASIVTPSWQQHLRVSANGAEPVEIALPNTVGMWDTTEPVEIRLAAGRNVLRFSHRSDGYDKGVTIKDFTLTPIR